VIRATTTHVSLLCRLASGEDHDAWRDFESRYGDLIRSFARRRGLQECDCDDVVQDVLVALTRNMPGFRYDPARGRFRGYLKTIAVRMILKKTCQTRGPAGQQVYDEAAAVAADDSDTESAWEAEWRQHHLRLAMATLRHEFNETDLAAFDAYAGRGTAPADVARQLGISVESVYQAKTRILRRLRELIASQTDEEG